MIALQSFLIYFGAWCRAFGPAERRDAPLSLRRLAFLIVIPCFLVVVAINWVSLLLDRLLFWRLTSVELRRPVFVLGVPRSGTTYLHRELAKDPAFSTTATWEATLAPAILQKKLARALGCIDRTLGSPLLRSLSWGVGKAATNVNDVHPIGLLDAEEDYLLMISAAGCFFMSLAFPSNRNLKDLGHLSNLPTPRQEQLLDHYHRLIQRQIYTHPGQLLSKNAAFASWMPSLAKRYPDALFVVCVRSPDEAIVSQVNSLASARAVFATYPDEARVSAAFRDHYSAWFDDLASFTSDSDANAIVIEQEWMRDHPEETLHLIYSRLDRSPPQLPLHTRAPSVSANSAPARSRTQNSHLTSTIESNYRTLQSIAVSQRHQVTTSEGKSNAK